MLREIILLLSITLLFFCLTIMKQKEGFADPPSWRARPEWAKLSDDEYIELQIVSTSAVLTPYIIDVSIDTDAKATVEGIYSIIGMGAPPVFNNRSDIDKFKNKIMNKLAENKNLSVVASIFKSNLKDAIKLGKRGGAAHEKGDQNLNQVILEDAKTLGKKCIRELKEKVPDFPFNPNLKKQFPEGFVETPKPTASECKRFFKCSSIYAA